MLAANYDISYAHFSKLLLLLRRMKLELPRLRQSNLTACSGVVRYSTGNHNATSLINSFRILNPASYPWRVVLLLGLKRQKWTSLKYGYIFAKGRELSESKRCIGVPPPCFLPICFMNDLSQYPNDDFFTQVPFARSSLNHDDVFILDTENKIFQFNGANSNIQERAKALEVIQHLKEKYHDGVCAVAIVGEMRMIQISFHTCKTSASSHTYIPFLR